MSAAMGVEGNSTSHSTTPTCPTLGFAFSDRYSLATLLNGPFTAIFVTTGFIFNCLSAGTFLSLKRRPRVHSYLIALAMWDNILLLNAFFLYGVPTFIYGHLSLIGNYVKTYPYTYALSNISLTGTIWMMVALCADRYYIIHKPIQNRIGPDGSSPARKATLIMIWLISIVAFAQGIPLIFEVAIDECLIPPNQTEITFQARPTALRQNPNYQIAYRITGGFLFNSIGPVLILFILLARITQELLQASRLRRRMSVRSPPAQ